MIPYEIFYNRLHIIFSQDPKINAIPLKNILDTIPSVDHLQNIPNGTPVIIRADLDMHIEDNVITDKCRIVTTLPTIEYCIEQGWKVIIFGHIGRDIENSLLPVCEAYGKEMAKKVEFISDWIDESNMVLTDDLVSKVKAGKPGSVFMLENTRKYNIETALWKAKEADFDGICEKMYNLASDIRKRLCDIEINEAIAASNFDFSSLVLPLVMSKTAMGFFISEDMRKHLLDARKANMVVFSGLKANKLDDLEAVVNAHPLKLLIAAGALAMALKKAQAQLEKSDFCIGKGETEEKANYFISKSRIDQGKRIVKKCKDKNIELLLPIDFILDNGEISKVIPKDRTQYDIGPETRDLITAKLEDYIKKSKNSPEPFTLFHNGVFGKFEDSRFEAGTKDFISHLKNLTIEGISTYVGGGEGRLALIKYGSLSDVTYAFTAGGTILKSLSDHHIQYLKAMYLQNKESNY
jgi:phosphoglycerate kinase